MKGGLTEERTQPITGLGKDEMYFLSKSANIYIEAAQVDSESLLWRAESREKKNSSQELTIWIEVSTLVNALETAHEVAKRSEPRKNNSLKAI